MHEALRHHTLLQLKTVGTPPAPGMDIGFIPGDPNSNFRDDGGSGVSLRNFLAGNRVIREYRRFGEGNECPVINRTVTRDPCPVQQAAELWAAKGPAYLEMFASPVSAVQRLMAELLGQTDEFRRLHLNSAGDDNVSDGEKKEDDVPAAVASTVSNFFSS